MESESMDNCFPTAKDRFRDHLQRPLDPWPYGTYKVETGDRVGHLLVQQLQLRQPLLRRHSGVPRFGIISGHCGGSLRKFLSNSVVLPAVSAPQRRLLGAATSRHPTSLVAPLLVYHANPEPMPTLPMFCYYVAASLAAHRSESFLWSAGTLLVGLSSV